MNEPLGNAAILAAGVMWAIALAYFQKGGEGMKGSEVNLAKNLVGLTFFALAALFVEGWRVGADIPAILALAGAGLLGMGVGDSLFLGAMKILGVGRTTVLVLTTPLITLAAETALLGWRPPLAQVGGILLVVAGVALAVGLGRHSKAEWQGVRMVLLASLAFSAGLLLTRWGFDRVGDDVGLLSSTMLRVGGGVLWLVAVLRLRPAAVLKQAYGPGPRRAPMVRGALLGTVFGLFLYQMAGKFTRATMVGALGAMVPLFAIPAAWVVDGERPKGTEIAGALLAVAGVVLVSLTGR